MQEIPLIKEPSQKIEIILGTQNCIITVFTRNNCTFCDLSVNNIPVLTGAICRNLVPLINSKYLNFRGNLFFFDAQKKADSPDYTGFGSRFFLMYLTENEKTPDILQKTEITKIYG